MRIVIDPGHGGKDPGALGINGLKEKEVNLAVSLFLNILLEDYDLEVFLTREEDYDVELAARVNLANSLKTDLLLSIHCNSFPDPKAKGVEIWHSHLGEFGNKYYKEAQEIARIIQKELVLVTGFSDRGIKTKLMENKNSAFWGQDYFYLLRKAHCPALIVELGFISNPLEGVVLNDPPFQKKMAQAILKGLVGYLNLKPKIIDKTTEKSLELPEIKLFYKNKQFKGFILGDLTYVETRKFAEALGLRVHWISGENKVVIED